MEIDLEPRCDDDSLPQDPEYPLNKWYSMLTNATADTGRPMAYNGKTKQLLESVGFVNVEDYTVKVSKSYRQENHPVTGYPPIPDKVRGACHRLYGWPFVLDF